MVWVVALFTTDVSTRCVSPEYHFWVFGVCMELVGRDDHLLQTQPRKKSVAQGGPHKNNHGTGGTATESLNTTRQTITETRPHGRLRGGGSRHGRFTRAESTAFKVGLQTDPPSGIASHYRTSSYTTFQLRDHYSHLVNQRVLRCKAC